MEIKLMALFDINQRRRYGFQLCYQNIGEVLAEELMSFFPMARRGRFWVVPPHPGASACVLIQLKDPFTVSRFYSPAGVSETIMAQTTIAYLEGRYAALEKKEIADALLHSPTDDFAVADLKSRKLIIADEIQHNRRLVERFSKLGAH